MSRTAFRAITLATLATLMGLTAAPALARDVPPLKGHVNDLGAVLSPATRQALELQLAEHERATTQQLVLLIVPSLGDDTIEDFSMRVAESWELGAKGEDNGLVLLVALHDHKMRIEVGYGLEGVVTDALASRLIREVLQPAFRKGDYDGGTVQAFAALMKLGRGETPEVLAEPAAADAEDTALGAWVVFIGLGLFCLLLRAAYLLERRLGMKQTGVHLGAGYSGSSRSHRSSSSGSYRGGGGGFGGGGASGGW